METLLQKIYNELKYLKKVNNQTHFGTLLGYEKSYTSTLLSSVKPLTPDLKERLVKVFGISARWLNNYTDKSDAKGMLSAETDILEDPTGGTVIIDEDGVHSQPHKIEGDNMNMLNKLIEAQMNYSLAAKDQAVAAKDTAKSNLLLTEMLYSRYNEGGNLKNAVGM
jgi:hypothetical protein